MGGSGNGPQRGAGGATWGWFCGEHSSRTRRTYSAAPNGSLEPEPTRHYRADILWMEYEQLVSRNAIQQWWLNL
jgi:hypothetical protein